MERYESPTIEMVGGVGNDVKPQAFIPFIDFIWFIKYVYEWFVYKSSGLPPPPWET